jgi:hypothetical protein
MACVGAPGCVNYFDRVIAWITLEEIPNAWVAQAKPEAGPCHPRSASPIWPKPTR